MVKKFEFFLIFLFFIKSIKSSSECLSKNINKSSEVSLSTCVGNTEEETNNTISCCLLKIERESNDDIYRCIEVPNDEDEIEKRITAFQSMYKNSIVSIDCKDNFINFKSLQIFLILLICLLL